MVATHCSSDLIFPLSYLPGFKIRQEIFCQVTEVFKVILCFFVIFSLKPVLRVSGKGGERCREWAL